VAGLQALPYNALSAGEKAWPSDFAAFLTAVRNMEGSFCNAAKLALERAGSLDARVQTLLVSSSLQTCSANIK
jgi:hypothetical protein